MCLAGEHGSNQWFAEKGLTIEGLGKLQLVGLVGGAMGVFEGNILCFLGTKN